LKPRNHHLHVDQIDEKIVDQIHLDHEKDQKNEIVEPIQCTKVVTWEKSLTKRNFKEMSFSHY